jgi:predicted PurR-regulated permease PerM
MIAAVFTAAIHLCMGRRRTMSAGHDDPDAAPTWVAPLIRRALWQAMRVLVTSGALVLVLVHARTLVFILVAAAFFAVAMEPAVTWLNRRHLSRGAATAVVLLAVVAFVLVSVFLLIPGIVTSASAIADRLPGWLDRLESAGITLGSRRDHANASDQFKVAMASWAHTQRRELVGIAQSGVGLVFQLITIVTFTCYLVANGPRLRRAVLTRVPPPRQQRLGWAWDTAIQQTGSYFYSRSVLMLTYAAVGLFSMVAVGLPWRIALPLAIFAGFLAQFVPVVGTYLGAFLPSLITLGIRGVVQGAVVLAALTVYQQVENYWLNPRLSSKSMHISGGVVLGAALAGGAVGGPLGAFMAQPAAALITSFVRTYGRTYPLSYHSAYDLDAAPLKDAESDQ